MSQEEWGKLCSFWNQSFHVGAWCGTILLAYEFVLGVERKGTFRITSKLIHKLQPLCFSKQIQNTFQYWSRVKILCKRDDWEDININKKRCDFTFLFGMEFGFLPCSDDGNFTFSFLGCPAAFTSRLWTLCWKGVSCDLAALFRSRKERFPKAQKTKHHIQPNPDVLIQIRFLFSMKAFD